LLSNPVIFAEQFVLVLNTGEGGLEVPVVRQGILPLGKCSNKGTFIEPSEHNKLYI
jgi:hypothetical protein